MKVFVTKWVVSGRLDYVDLTPSHDGKYWSGDCDGVSYFVSSKDVSATPREAKKQISERFKKRIASLEKSISDLPKIESSMIWDVENQKGGQG